MGIKNLKPVLITGIGDLPDMAEDGKTGKILEPENPDSLANGIKWFLENKNINFFENIGIFVENNMSWQSLVRK